MAVVAAGALTWCDMQVSQTVLGGMVQVHVKIGVSAIDQEGRDGDEVSVGVASRRLLACLLACHPGCLSVFVSALVLITFLIQQACAQDMARRLLRAIQGALCFN